MLSNFNNINNEVNEIGDYFGHNENCTIWAATDAIKSQIEAYKLNDPNFIFSENENLGSSNIEKCRSTAPNNI
jgi:hypothetical protein